MKICKICGFADDQYFICIFIDLDFVL